MIKNDVNKNDLILSIKDLAVEYVTSESTIYAVNGVSLDVAKGETIGLVGETGAGKTTIAKSILRILPDPPAKVRGGEIVYNGQSLLKLPESQMRKVRGKKISMIFQDPMTALNPIFTVGDQIAEVIRLHENMGKKEAWEKGVDMLELVGIPGTRYGEYPHQFSGGMKQRVVIAMALACNPELLLADEPTTALDVTIQAQVLEMMVKLREELGTSMIMITHDFGIVAEVCDRVAVVYAGEIVEIGPVITIFDNTMHPYTRGLFGSLPSLTGDQGRLTPIKGMMPNPTKLPKGCKFSPRCPHVEQACIEGNVEFKECSSGHWVRCVKAGEI